MFTQARAISAALGAEWDGIPARRRSATALAARSAAWRRCPCSAATSASWPRLSTTGRVVPGPVTAAHPVRASTAASTRPSDSRATPRLQRSIAVTAGREPARPGISASRTSAAPTAARAVSASSVSRAWAARSRGDGELRRRRARRTRERSPRPGQVLPAARRVPRDDGARRPHERDEGTRGVVREAAEELVQPAGGTLGQQPAHREVLDDVHARVVPVATRRRVPDRLVQQVVGGQPPGGGAMEDGDPLRGLVRQLGPQELAEQRVDPVAPGVVRDLVEEDIVARQQVQLMRCARPGEHLDQARPEHVDDTRAEQRRAHLGRLGVEDLGEEVVGDRAAVTRQRPCGRVLVLAVGQGERGEPQARGPAACPGHDRLHRGCREVDAGAAQQHPRLAGREGQVSHADLHHRAVEPVAVEREHRVRPGEEHEPQPARRPLDEELEPGGGVGRECALVVEHEDDRVGARGDVGGQGGEEEAGARRVARRGRLDGWGDAVASERQQDERPEVAVLQVTAVEGDPRDRQRGLEGRPGRHQHRLARPGRCAHERQGSLGALAEPLPQPWPVDRAVRSCRHHEARVGGARTPGRAPGPSGEEASVARPLMIGTSAVPPHG